CRRGGAGARARSWNWPISVELQSHVPVEASGETVIRWKAFEPNIITSVDDPANVRLFDAGSAQAVVSAILAPPPDEQERAFLLTFLRERPRAIRPRIEYPLLLAA